ncbi:hypothetical protein SB397_06220 [Burkholderia multivorans]|uniref:hypothetical protein n=1 Tax=Burkholderia multivorans TaxID=87883 RepID=UPI001E61570C|nr:hypothetical protein [Burkholderia multivorans]MEB2485172.1 hypothetical protein [Burkholderia multivorans]MEB2567234.1 hypothetical protein [Burkholderia multivorans]
MNAMRAALAPIPAEPCDALTAERRIADHAPTPAGAARREPPRGVCATMHASRARVRETSPADAPTRRRAYSPTHRRPTKSPSTSPPPSRRPRNRPRHPSAQIVALTDPI